MDPTLYTHPSPLSGPWDSKANNLPPLPTTISHDGKSLVNVHPAEGSTEGPVARSAAYERFVAPLDNGIRGGFDVHIYYFQENPILLKFARELHERIRREFPELRIYKFWTAPVGPHPVAMFEVNLFTPQQFGAFIPWLVINRGPLSVLIHPNTVDDKGEEIDEERNHTQRATWMGERIPLDMALFRDPEAWRRAREEALKAGEGRD